MAADAASSATPRPALTSSRMLAGLCVSKGTCGVKPACAPAASRIARRRGHGRLGDAQLAGSTGEAAESRNGLEVGELPQLHRLIVESDGYQRKTDLVR